MWKRLLTTLLTAALLLPTLAAAAPSLPDIKGHWAEASIRKAVESGWVDGYPDGSFQPEKTITRAEFTKMLLDAIHLTPDCETVAWMKETAAYRPDGQYLYEEYQPKLFDMKDHWLSKQGWLDAAMYSGMVVPKDYNDYIFRPEKPIARYEIALMADRALGLVYPANKEVTEPLPFTDSEEFSDWKAGYINEAVKAGIITGYPDGTFGSTKTATRAEAVVIVQRVVDEMEAGTAIDLTVVGQFREYFFGEKNTNEIVLEQAVTGLHLRQIGHVVYAPVLELYNSLNHFALERGLEAYFFQWVPVEQRFRAYNFTAQWPDSFWPGVSSFSFHNGVLPDAGNAVKTTVPLRFLCGQVMLPIYDFSQGNVPMKNPWAENWYCSWDDASKTLYLPLHYFHSFAMSS